MFGLPLFGERTQLTFGTLDIWLTPRLVQLAADEGALDLRQMFEHVAAPVLAAPLNDIAEAPKVLMTAARMALPPSVTNRRGCSMVTPRSMRLLSSALQTVLFSVVPSQSPKGCLRPSASTPRATTTQCSATSIPSMNTATRSSWLRSRPNSSASFCSVPWMKRREIADLEVAREST